MMMLLLSWLQFLVLVCRQSSWCSLQSVVKGSNGRSCCLQIIIKLDQSCHKFPFKRLSVRTLTSKAVTTVKSSCWWWFTTFQWHRIWKDERKNASRHETTSNRTASESLKCYTSFYTVETYCICSCLLGAALDCSMVCFFLGAARRQLHHDPCWIIFITWIKPRKM